MAGQRVEVHRAVAQFHIRLAVHPHQGMHAPVFVVAVRVILVGVGATALFPVFRAEDGAKAIADYGITNKDVLVGITAGGTTPYVQGALAEANCIGAKTVFVSCVPADQVPYEVDVDIRLLTGPEILAGSTRLKAGTVTKMVLNILSTSVMVKLGKVYGNRMIDVSVTNDKLYDRALRIIQDLTDLPRPDAETLLDKSRRKVKTALLMHWNNLEFEAAEAILAEQSGNLRGALKA